MKVGTDLTAVVVRLAIFLSSISDYIFLFYSLIYSAYSTMRFLRPTYLFVGFKVTTEWNLLLLYFLCKYIPYGSIFSTSPILIDMFGERKEQSISIRAG